MGHTNLHSVTHLLMDIVSLGCCLFKKKKEVRRKTVFPGYLESLKMINIMITVFYVEVSPSVDIPT